LIISIFVDCFSLFIIIVNKSHVLQMLLEKFKIVKFNQNNTRLLTIYL